MKSRVAGALRAALWSQGLAALLLSLVICLLTVLVLALAFAVIRLPDWGLGPWLAASLALLPPAAWAVAQALKSANFLWAFGRWPGGLEDALEPPARAWAAAAGQAFEQGDVDRATRLLEKLPKSPLRDLAWGRSCALAGDLDAALPLLERGSELPRVQDWLRPRRWLGAPFPPYLGAGQGERARRAWPVWAVLGLVLAGIGGVVVGLDRAVAPRVAALARGFDSAGFDTVVQGRFVLHYHDPAFAAKVGALAEDALEKDLAFLGLAPDLFGSDEIHLFLCEDQSEYLKRSPRPVPWEAACALPDKDVIWLYKYRPAQDVYFQVVVAHELAHLVYHRMGFSGREDHWLNEGLADYLGHKYAFDRNNIPRQAWLQEHEFNDLKRSSMPFKAFFETDPHELADAEEVGTFYRQGFSLVAMLIDDYGQPQFLKFLRTYADGYPEARALAMTYPSLADPDALGAVWGLFYQDHAATPTPR